MQRIAAVTLRAKLRGMLDRVTPEHTEDNRPV